MKVKDLKLNDEVIINSFKYAYKGVNKIRKSGYWIQQIVFNGVDVEGEKHFDLNVGNKELKEVNGKWELK